MHLLMRKSSSPASRTKDLAVWYSLTMHSERRTSLLLGRLEKIELSERAADGLGDLAAADELQYGVEERGVSQPRFPDVFSDHHNLKGKAGGPSIIEGSQFHYSRCDKNREQGGSKFDLGG